MVVQYYSYILKETPKNFKAVNFILIKTIQMNNFTHKF